MEVIELFLITLLMSPVQNTPNSLCNRIQIGDKFYERELLWGNVGRPHNLIVYKPTNTLFFSYVSPDSELDFQLAFYNIDTREYQTIAGIRGGCSVATDAANEEIYIGGNDGIYKFNALTELADFYKEKGQNIWSLFHKKHLFYISYPNQKLHVEVDGKFAVVKEFTNIEIDHFFITSSNDIYFANKTGLFKYDNGNKIIEVVDELISIRQIAEDNDGTVYVCSNFGVLMEGDGGFKKIVDIKHLFGLTFDRDNNFIISDENNIIKLKPSTVNCSGDNLYW